MGAGQFHLDPESYMALIRAEVPAYDDLQDAVATATGGRAVGRWLDLGTGTGATARRVRAHHPDAALVALDASPEMVAVAGAALPGADVRVGRLEDALPDGPFDLVVSALAVHHLTSADKADLFRRVAAVLGPGGRFVLADVIVPDDPAAAEIPLEEGIDRPDRIDDQLGWLADAGVDATVVWARADLVVIVADRPER